MPTVAMAHEDILNRIRRRNAQPPALRLVDDVEEYMLWFLDQIKICGTHLERGQQSLLDEFMFRVVFAQDYEEDNTPLHELVSDLISTWDICFKKLENVTLEPLQIVYLKKCSDIMLKLKVLMKDKDAGNESV
jgi:hypothetical protein